MFKSVPFVRFISIPDMSTYIRTDYEALVGFLDSKIGLLLMYHSAVCSGATCHTYNEMSSGINDYLSPLF